jgi:hypothetical protein
VTVSINATRDFRVGQSYSNDQIRFSLEVENLGGIRPSLDSRRNLRHVAVLTTAAGASRVHSENPYRDRIEGDILIYTAQGRKGDQDLGGRNKRLLEQYAVPVPLFGFMNVGKQEYRFLGLLELLRSYPETQVDTSGKPRRAWLFEFRIHSEPNVVPLDHASTICAQILAESRRTISELERQVAALAENRPETEVIPFPAIEKLRAQMFQAHPISFEGLVKELMLASRFVNVSVTRASGDGGIDVNAFVGEADDYFSGTHVQVQVKRWRHAVGSVEINNFRGALDTTAKGVFITTSHYTRAATVEARLPSKPCITLIDGSRFASMVLHSRIDCAALLKKDDRANHSV